MARYTVALITYLDILGFEAIVQTRSASHIKAILDELHQESKPDDETARLYSMRYFNFSDHVVRVTNLLARSNVKQPTGLLFHEILGIVHMQSQLLIKDVFISGSITVGEIYTGHGLIFGRGLNRAHELEGEVAKYPMIVIDPIALNIFATTPALKAGWHTHKEERDYLRSSIRRDRKDRVQFVDYLTSMGDEVDEPVDYAKFITEHRDMIQANRKRHRNAPRVLAKYNWLRRYHNDVVDRLKTPFFKTYRLTRAGLRIPTRIS